MVQLKEKTNKKFSQWFKDKDVPEFKLFEKENEMLRLADKKDLQSPGPKIQIELPDDTIMEECFTSKSKSDKKSIASTFYLNKLH